jgi:hypothetical protein
MRIMDGNLQVVYPAELCTIEAGQFYRKKVPTELTKSVVDFATKNPQERLHIINSGVGLGQQGGLAAPVSDSRSSTTNDMRLTSSQGARISDIPVYSGRRSASSIPHFPS